MSGATNYKRKYLCLLEHLESMGLLCIPMLMREIMAKPALQGAYEASYHIEITANVRETLIIYVQPNGNGPNVISFSEFAEVIRRHNEPIS